jgi:hypothetical protein
MKLINKLLSLAIALLVLGFVYVWIFVPEEKREIQDWWYEMIIDCDQMHGEISTYQVCKRNADCELPRKESIRAAKLEEQYAKYCGEL